jgi:hypothetical protein
MRCRVLGCLLCGSLSIGGHARADQGLETKGAIGAVSTGIGALGIGISGVALLAGGISHDKCRRDPSVRSCDEDQTVPYVALLGGAVALAATAPLVLTESEHDTDVRTLQKAYGGTLVGVGATAMLVAAMVLLGTNGAESDCRADPARRARDDCDYRRTRTIAWSAIAIGALSVGAGVLVFATRAGGDRVDGAAVSGLTVPPTLTGIGFSL